MFGSGKGKYLTEICWKLSIFASKALISCIFPKNIINFCNFPKIYVCTMFLIKAFFPETWKRPKNVHSLPRIVYFKSPSDLSSFFQWKRLLKGCSELIFVFSLLNLYLQNNFNQNIVHKSGLTTQKNKVKVPCLSQINQPLPVPYSHASPKRNSVFSLPSVSNCLKIIINKLFINTSQ